MVKIACPGADQYRQLLLGEVPEEQSEVLEQHLSECDPCAQTVANLQVNDTLVQALQKGAPVAQQAEQAVGTSLLDRVRGIRPDSDVGTQDLQANTGDLPAGGQEAAGEVRHDFLAPPKSPDEI